MPLYEYQCDACGHRFEHIQKFSDPLLTVCPKCRGAIRKLVSSAAIQFKGTGWYVTDYAKKDSGAEADKSSDGKDAKSDKSDKSEKTDKSDKTKSGDSKSSPGSKTTEPSSTGSS
jgi:putative FmdB family regulatory protein